MDEYIARFRIPDGYKIGCAVAKICPDDGKIRCDKDFENAYADTIKANGMWIPENRRPKSWSFYCSECKRTAYDPQNHHSNVPKRCRYAYCPHCGAKMDGKESYADWELRRE